MRKLHFNGIHITSEFLTKIFSCGMATAVTIFPFVFYRTEIVKQNTITRTHEIIHIRQQFEMGLAGIICSCLIWLIVHSLYVFLPALFIYYILYFAFYIVYWIGYKDQDKAYRENPFEKEAYLNDNFMYYPDMRKCFAWMKYL